MKSKKLGRYLFIVVSLVLLFALFTLPINPNSVDKSSNLVDLSINLLTGKAFEDPPVYTTISLAGDVLLGRTVMTKSLDSDDFTYAFEYVEEKLNESDLVIVNLENPFVTGCKRDYDSTVFCAVPEMVEGLSVANIGIVNLANNHSKNYGEEGLRETLAVLKSRSIDPVGLNEHLIKEINGTKFGVIGFDFFTKIPADEDFELVKKTSELVDVLILTIHWGIEYTPEPTSTQKEWARKLVESGADVIAGHHPHWVQTIEYINDKPVYYSLGNFVFDQMGSDKTREGLVVNLTFDEEGDVVKEEQIKTYMENWAQPKFVDEWESEK